MWRENVRRGAKRIGSLALLAQAWLRWNKHHHTFVEWLTQDRWSMMDTEPLALDWGPMPMGERLWDPRTPFRLERFHPFEIEHAVSIAAWVLDLAWRDRDSHAYSCNICVTGVWQLKGDWHKSNVVKKRQKSEKSKNSVRPKWVRCVDQGPRVVC